MKTRPKRKPFIVVVALVLLAAALFVETATAQNLVVNGDFENGNTGFTTQYSFGNVSNPGSYNIGTNPSSAPGAFGDWCNCGDHTTGAGMMLIANGATSASWPVWEQVVRVSPNKNYQFSYWGAEVDHDSNSLPRLVLKINGRPIGSNIFQKNSPDNGGQWQNFSLIWNSGPSRTADLALYDLNADATWNDFALDDISFMPAGNSQGAAAVSWPGAPAPGHDTATSGSITTRAEVTIKGPNRNDIALKPAEKVAVMFMQAIQFMEDDCMDGLKRRCSLAELAAGVNSPNVPIGRLRYDPARDPNYKYTITVLGRLWAASAIPQHSGLGGFYVEGGKSLVADTFYKPNGPATDNDLALSEIAIDGESFRVR
jgi:hypothetical protein